MYFKQPEVAKLSGEVSRLMKDVADQTSENLAERVQIAQMLEQYDVKFATHESLRGELEALNKQMSLVQQNLGKEKVTNILGQKAKQSEMKATAIEKQFLKSEIDAKSFINNFIKERSDYHKYQILKVKIAQS
jgi:Modifier of rudimentary (Mod(r)) protein